MKKHFRYLLMLSFVVFLLSSAFDSHAQLAGWPYTQPITLKENSGNNLYNYPVRLTINTQALIAASQLSSTGNDIRFGKDAAGTVLYHYWIESAYNTTSTVIWVNVDTLVGHQCKTIYMFYGNPGAPATSSIDGCFEGPFSATDSLSSHSYAGNAQTSEYEQGFAFQTNVNIVITQLGRCTYQANIPVRLYDDWARTLVQSATFYGTSAVPSYTPVSSLIWLFPGHTYLVTTTSSYQYTSAFGQPINSHLTSYGTKYGTGNSYPGGTGANYITGYPDFLFYAWQSVSPGVSFTMADNALHLNLASNVTECAGHSMVIGDTATGAIGTVSYIWTPSTGLSDVHVAKPTLSTASPQTYTLVATDSASGCATSATVAVSVAATATNQITDTICQGFSHVINGHTYTTSGTFVDTIALASSAGCDSIVTLNLTVHPKPAPTILQTGDSLFTGFYSNYQWLYLNTPVTNSNLQTIYAAHPGTYQVVVTDANGCTDTSAAYTFTRTGISGPPVDVELGVYPNPNHGSFTVNIPQSLVGKQLTITDNLGRTIATRANITQTENIHLTDLPAGVYVVTVGNKSVRFVVEK